jgi:hypothetical protein
VDSIALDSSTVALIVGFGIALVLVARWLRGGGRKPAQKSFRCARCSSVEAYSNRTIEAWRAGKTKLFCTSCHAKWLQSQPSGTRADRSRHSGCLGMIILCVVMPVFAIGAVCIAWYVA